MVNRSYTDEGQTLLKNKNAPLNIATSADPPRAALVGCESSGSLPGRPWRGENVDPSQGDPGEAVNVVDPFQGGPGGGNADCDEFKGEWNRRFQISSCDNRKMVIRVLWLPIWASDEALADEFRMFCTIKNVAKEFKDGLMTGTRLLSIHCRENDIHKIPYCESKRRAGVGPRETTEMLSL